MSAALALLYLHGLASSPRGRKRAILEDRFGPDGFTVVAPDLNVPSFRELAFIEMGLVARAAFERALPRLVVGSGSFPGSRFHRVEGGDHGLIEFGDRIEAAVRERLAG